MNKKFWYLTKVSLNKKIKSKWFIITNVILAIVIILLLNINSVITFFGGDFDSRTNIIIVDNNTNASSLLKENLEASNSEDEEKFKILESDKTIEEEQENLEDDKIIIALENSDEEYLKASIISNNKIDNLTYQLLSQALTATKTTIGMAVNNIDYNILNSISSPITIDRVVLNEETDVDENMNLIMSSVFPTIILPFFMLTIFFYKVKYWGYIYMVQQQ